jgi:putative membrane protein
MPKDSDRFPNSVYGVGGEPDSRFTLANERTFLTWIQTSLAIIASGVAIEELQVGDNPALRTIGSILMILGGALLAIYSFARWRKSERAMRLKLPMPSLGIGFVLSIVTAAAALFVVLLILF